MPILGKVNAQPYEFRVENTIIGEDGFFHCDYIIVTELAMFLDILSPVLSEEGDDISEELFEFIPIKRIGPGLTEDDFEVDFSNSDKLGLKVEPMSIYFQLMREREKYIMFTKFEIGINNPGGEVINKSELEILQEQLQKATEAQDYIKAGEINNKIKLLKEKQKEKKNK